jgi:hypothetical protein
MEQMDDHEFSLYFSQNGLENSWINRLVVISCLSWSIIAGIEKWIESSNRIWFRFQKFPHCDAQRNEWVNRYRSHRSRRWPVNPINNWENLELMSQFCVQFRQNWSDDRQQMRVSEHSSNVSQIFAQPLPGNGTLTETATDRSKSKIFLDWRLIASTYLRK